MIPFCGRNGIACDGDGRRVYKSSGKLYWYGPEASGGSEILAETDGSRTVTSEYVYFGGKRIAMLPAGGSPQYYVEDFLGSSRVVTQSNGVVCYDSDFTPFGGELAYTSTCPAQNNYKFEGKERDTETGNDDFGARYYTWRFGRWLSADWSAVPVAVPYANLTNPQTLNLYAMVADDPESFADLDGHEAEGGPEAGTAGGGSLDTRTTSSNGTRTPPTQGEPQLPPTTPTESAATNQQQNLEFQDKKEDKKEGSQSDQKQDGQKQQDSGTQASAGKGGKGGRGKGERRWTSKPDKATKGAKPIRDSTGKIVGYLIPSPDGKGVRKTLDWGAANGLNPADFSKKVALGAAAVATVGVVIHAIIATAPEWGPWVAAALAF